MTIAVLADDAQWEELNPDNNRVDLVRLESLDQQVDADAYIILQETTVEAINNLEQPILLNAVNSTLKELQTNTNVVRINGWNGFLSRTSWEVAGNITDAIQQVFSTLKKEYISIADEPGLVAASVIAMIINEVYFALGEEVSSKNEIDIAMKLGTNYPFGPFEWAEKIGIKNIYSLLHTLSKTDSSYLPAPLLQKEANA